MVISVRMESNCSAALHSQGRNNDDGITDRPGSFDGTSSSTECAMTSRMQMSYMEHMAIFWGWQAESEGDV
jgi:hypothetical protein